MGFKLISFDLDGTLIKVPAMAVVLSYTDAKKMVEFNRIEELMEKRIINYQEALKKQFELIKGVNLRDLRTALDKAPFIKGISEVIYELKLMGLKTILISDNPDVICKYVKEKFGLDDFLCSKVSVNDGKIVGIRTLLTDKLEALKSYNRKFGIDLSECIHIGDWDNDIPLFENVGFSIAVNPKNEDVKKKAKKFVENLDDLRILLDLLPINQLD